MSESRISAVTVGDVSTAYDSVGEGSPPLVLVHGFAGCADNDERP